VNLWSWLRPTPETGLAGSSASSASTQTTAEPAAAWPEANAEEGQDAAPRLAMLSLEAARLGTSLEEKEKLLQTQTQATVQIIRAYNEPARIRAWATVVGMVVVAVAVVTFAVVVVYALFKGELPLTITLATAGTGVAASLGVAAVGRQRNGPPQ